MSLSEQYNQYLAQLQMQQYREQEAQRLPWQLGAVIGAQQGQACSKQMTQPTLQQEPEFNLVLLTGDDDEA